MQFKVSHYKHGQIENVSSSLQPLLFFFFLIEARLFISIQNHHRLLQRMSANAYVVQIYYSFSQLLRQIS